MVEAVGSRIHFDRLLYFPWLKNILNPDRELSDLELDCLWSKKGTMRIEILPGLFEMLSRVDTSTMTYDVYGKEKSKGKPTTGGDIGFIVVCAFVRADCWPVIEDGRLMIYKRGESGAMELPDGYQPSRVERFERKADKKAETKKPDLHIVPKRGARKKKAAKYPKVPKEIMAWCKDHYPRGEWKRIVRGLHKFCRYKKRREDKYYPGTSKRKNRQYVYGQQWLADKLGIERRTVETWFHRFEADGIIYIPYRGYKKRGASICELAFKDGHRKKNKRETGERKNPLSIR